MVCWLVGEELKFKLRLTEVYFRDVKFGLDDILLWCTFLAPDVFFFDESFPVLEVSENSLLFVMILVL
jgi:hypothetical protein